MTQEEKQLLLVDLCGRLPYGVMVRVEGEKYFNETKEPYITNLSLNNYILDYDDVTITPYLRPMSSMTEEEKEELRNLIDEKLNCGIDSENEWSPWALYDSTGIKNMIGGERFYFDDMSFIYDWLDAHHFDYRGLIHMGLAIEAHEGVY